MPRQGRRLARDPLHHVAIAAHRVDVVVEELEAGTVEVGRLPATGDRHPDAGGDPLAQRPGGGLDPGGQAVFGMSGALAVELPEALDVLELYRELPLPFVLRVHRLHASEMQHGVQQHRGVAVGEHEPVAVGPDGVLGIEAQEVLPQAIDHRGQGHRGAGVPGVGGLHRVHRKGANGIDDQEVGVLGFGGHGALSLQAHSRSAPLLGLPRG
jgi:hypothetical protein